MNSLTAAVVAAPFTLLVMSNMASNTANITGSDVNAIRKTTYVTAGVLLAAAVVSGNGGIIVSTALALAATAYLTTPLWFGAKS